MSIHRSSRWLPTIMIGLFGGLHGVRDKGAVEAAVFRPQTGYYNSIERRSSRDGVAREQPPFLDCP
jgi:hypothetical protein